MKTHILHSDNLSNIEWRRATFKECLLQGKGWVCPRINLSGCLGRGCPSRSHSEGLTSHRSYGRTRSSRGPPTSIARKVSRQTWAKDHEGCISHCLLAQVFGKIDQVSLFQEKTERARRWWGDQGRLARRRTSAWVLHSPPRPTRTPTCSTRASTNSTLDSCWPMEEDRRHLLIPCCFR